MNLTNEQISIIESSGNIKINAVAGSGKTTTLIEYAKAREKKGRTLYIAFNKSVRTEAVKKFAEKGIKNIRIETAHSLAYAYVVKGTNYTVRKEGSYKTQEVAEILKLNGFNQKHTEYILANHINKFTAYFCNSSKSKVQELNYADVLFDAKSRQFAENFKNEIVRYTRTFLDKMNRGEIEITHDFYLKKFQQHCPQLPFDFVLFDEGQDASEAMLDVFLAQQATKVIVGDTHQQIYGWRYAVNSLERVDYPVFHLSSSFRFDNEIASLAARVLKWKSHYAGKTEKVVINGYGNDGETATKAVIARTNTALLIKAIELLIVKKEIRKIYFEGRFERYTYADEGASIYDVLNLHTGKRHLIKDKLIASMQNMEELEDYIEKTEDAQLALIVEVVVKYGGRLPDYIRKIKENHLENDEKQKADMIFSTVHRCKGMEYDEVTLTADFVTEEKVKKLVEEIGKEKINTNKLSEEINLLYVAVTRTKQKLNIPVELLPASKINPVIPASEDDAIKEHEKKYSVQGTRLKVKNAYFPWTLDEEDRLTEMFCEGAPIKEIAKRLGRSTGSITSRVEKLELREIYDID